MPTLHAYLSFFIYTITHELDFTTPTLDKEIE